MFYALATGKLDTGDLQFRSVLKDIHSLNLAAASSLYHVTAISVAAYPAVASSYQLLPCGGSLGVGYGPVVVAPRQMEARELLESTIAIPGRTTSAYLALKLYLGAEPEAEEVPFDSIIDRVAAGNFAAGLLIHEGQLTFRDSGLVMVADLGAWWREETGLPLPLGANVVRRDLPDSVKVATASHIRNSIAYALANRDEALEFALRFSRGIAPPTAARFVGMYVNDYTVELGTVGRRAIEALLTRGFPSESNDGSIPLDYVKIL